MWDAASKNGTREVYDPTGRNIQKTDNWQMGHLAEHKFSEAQLRAAEEGWTREHWIEYQNDPAIYRPEFPITNEGHGFEAVVEYWWEAHQDRWKTVNMKTQQEFAANGMVSIWIGDFSSEAQFDKYMNLTRDFEKDFGFKIDDRDIREGVVENGPRPIEKLVEGFSSWESFSSAAVEACKKIGVTVATTMIVFYTVEFDPSKTAVNPSAPLKFIGSFPFC